MKEETERAEIRKETKSVHSNTIRVTVKMSTSVPGTSTSAETSAENSAPTSGASSTPTSGASSASRQAIRDGQNFRVIQGSRKNSKIFVQDNFLYVLDKSEEDTHYLKCKYNPNCQARAIVKDGYLTAPNVDKTPHNCEGQQQVSFVKLTAVEVLNRMKKRASSEGTSLYVSNLIFFSHLNTKIALKKFILHNFLSLLSLILCYFFNHLQTLKDNQ